MGEWASYTLHDLLLFSDRVYFRQFELANEQVWPVQILFIAAGLFAASAIWRGDGKLLRACAMLLAVLTGSSAWFYLYSFYGQINWAVDYMLPLFAVQAAALLATAAVSRLNATVAQRVPRRAAAVMLAAVAVAYPLVSLVGDRALSSAEVIGIAADPTMLAVLAFAAGLESRWRLALAVVPVLWCLQSVLTLATLGAAQYLLVLAMTVAICGLVAMPSFGRTDPD